MAVSAIVHCQNSACSDICFIFSFFPIHTAQCKFVITCNQGVRGGRFFDLKTTVDEAVKSCPSVRHVFVAKRTNNSMPMGKLDIPLDEVNHPRMTSCSVQRLESQIRNIFAFLYVSARAKQLG